MSALLRGAALAATLLAAGWAAGLPAQADRPGAAIKVAQGGRKGGMHGGGTHGGGQFKGQQQAGRSNFPHGCHAVCSGFHSRTRCDGTTRSPKFPVHRGIDVAVPVGTPLIAIADGTVASSGRGPSIGGIGLVIRHPPAATGLSTYTYSFYKHLDAVSPLPKGAHVRKGQEVGKSGKSGTEGSIHFGSEGFAELHFEIWNDASATWPSGHLTDPVAFLRRTADRTGWFCH